MKKKISILAIIFAIILCVGTRVNGASETKTVYTEAVNPIYANENIDQSNILTHEKKFDTTNAAKIEYIEDKQTLAINVRDNMVQRKTQFYIYAKMVINAKMNDNIYGNYVDEIVNMAMSEELSNSSSCGDYLKYSFRGYNAPGSYSLISTTNGKYTYEIAITLNASYYTTNNQEKELNEGISNYIKNNINLSDSKYKKICKIYDYITANVSYDNKNLYNSSYLLKFSAYAAFINKTAVCQGYSTLLYKMLKEAGVNTVRIIVNQKGDGVEGHAWNIVSFNDTYYNVDATWDSNYNNGIGTPNYRYFLKGINTFIKDKEHKMAPEFYTTQFSSKYKISNEDYQGNGEDSDTGNPKKITGFKLKNNYVDKVTLKWNKQVGANSYQIYQYNSKSKKYDIFIGTKNVNTTTATIKKLNNGTTYKFAIRAIINANNRRLYGEFTYLKATTKPSKVTISKAKSPTKKKVTIKWKKVSNSSGYYIEYSTNSKFKNLKKVQIKSKKTISKTIKKLKRNKKYYIRIRAYKTVDNKKVYGDYSKVKSVKVK